MSQSAIESFDPVGMKEIPFGAFNFLKLIRVNIFQIYTKCRPENLDSAL